MRGFELGIEGGTLVRPVGCAPLNVYVRDGQIAELAPERRPAAERVDASGLFVMPGMVDAHVHLMDPGDLEREDFPTGTAAAAQAGVTTVIEHTHAAPVRSAGELEEKRAYLAKRARVDFALAAHAWPDRLDDAAEVWRVGAAFLKAFTCTTHGVPAFDRRTLRALFRRTRQVGATCLVHCEDDLLTRRAEERLRSEGRDDPAVIVEWRNREAEAAALATVAALARETRAHVVVAHVSTANGARDLARERDAGATLGIETCPQYLLLFEHEIDEHGPFRKFTPPARARSEEDLAALWAAVADGTVDYVASDHAPATRAQKLSGSIWDVHFGLPGIDTTFPLLLDAAHAGRLSYERVVDLYAERPARAYGLFPRKGAILPGSDADVVIVDPGTRWTISADTVISKARWSPYEGREVIGKTVASYVRGLLVGGDAVCAAEPGTGRFVPGRGGRP